MNRESARTVVLALLCVLAIGLAASTLNTPVQTDSSGGGIGGPAERLGANGDGGTSVGVGNVTNRSSDSPLGIVPSISLCVPWLKRPLVIAAIVGALVLGALVAFRRTGFPGAIVVGAGLGIPALFIHALLTSCTRATDTRFLDIRMPNNTSLPVGGSGGLQPGSTGPSAPSVALTLLLGATLVAALVLFVRSTGGDTFEYDEDSEPEPTASEPVVAVGRAAGAAADRIETAGDLENEVFRAWREMTTHLDVASPETSTPAEFAAAAVDAGLDRSDVAELTSLFEAVRYGDKPATTEREDRAVAALRRIEETYAHDEDRSTDDGRPGGDGA